MSDPLVVVDADVLGRHRTGDETYVSNLLRELGTLDHGGLRIAAVTRYPYLVPPGIEPLELATTSQEWRMLRTFSQLLEREGAALVHTQYALPARLPCPAVVTIHDLSFERDPTLMPWKDRLVFRRVVPRAARAAERVLTVSERTRADLVELYGLPDEKIVVTPNGAAPAFTPREGPRDTVSQGSFVLAVGAVQRRKNQRAAAEAAREVGLPLVIAGPAKDEALAAELRARGADLRGYVTQAELVELYRDAACLVQPSRYEGFGLPVLEAMACGTPVVTVDEPALREVAGDAAVVVDEAHLADGLRRALAERERLVAAGLERARIFSWRASAEKTLAVYREVLA